MKEKQIIVIGSDEGWEEKQIIKTACEENLNAFFWRSKGLQICLEENRALLFYEEKDVTDIFKNAKIVFRRTRGDQDYFTSLVVLADQWGVKHLDSTVSILTNLHKAQSIPTIKTKLIKHIPTVFLRPNEKVLFNKFKINPPLVMKPVHGRHGEGIKFFDSVDDLEKNLKESHSGMLVQKALEIECEYRVFILGNSSLGCVKKVPVEGSRVANYASGAVFETVNLPQQIQEEAIEICRSQGIDIGGVDLAFFNKDWYLLEVNRCPEFKAFSSASGIDVAKKIVDYLLKK